jgi:hypothetical protein
MPAARSGTASPAAAPAGSLAPQRLTGIARAIATLAAWQFLLLGAAQAQAPCVTGATPPPPPPKSVTATNEAFGSPPLPGFLTFNDGEVGCNGAAGGADQSGSPGSAGQPGGRLDITATGVTSTGGSQFLPPNSPYYGGYFLSRGGPGGQGGQGGSNVFSNNVVGGAGGAGGVGGPLTMTFEGRVDPGATGRLATAGLLLSVQGGDGGRGGNSNETGLRIKVAGDGGPAGAAGTVALSAGGSFLAAEAGLSVLADGGSGGRGGDGVDTEGLLLDTYGGMGGAGGKGGGATLQLTAGTVQVTGPTIVAGNVGLNATASGGRGGDGGGAERTDGRAQGGDGGAGGAGGTAAVTSAGAVAVTATSPYSLLVPIIGVAATANGGDGGTGSSVSGSTGGGGGTGGNAGAGGSASATILGSVTPSVPDDQAFAATGVQVQANGGVGGRGGTAGALIGQGGGGGFGGAGGSASLVLGDTTRTATVTTTGYRGIGALVQSVGGGGGNGGSIFSLFGMGGDGATGGDGGPVKVSGANASVIVTGHGGIGLLAQSVGGGGGNGGDATDVAIGASFAIGGNGGVGGSGSTVRVDLAQGVIASTDPNGSRGILAQSIGGAGGNGGSVASTGVGLLTLVIGGDGATGGGGGAVTVNTGVLVSTSGGHATGVQAQSIGGGGGTGGAAISFLANGLPAAAVSVGGRGGSGGPGGNVTVANTDQVTTYGPDSYGVLAQSVGGGGGNGGVAAARAATLVPGKEVPAISVSVAIGGRGGTGNTGGTVGFTNSGLIATSGHGAHGVFAQSVGGGGGNGGDSSAASFAVGPQTGIGFSASVAVGGSGGSGGLGGQVTMGNTGLVITLGQDAYGVMAQSVGGGGGTGGSGDATGTADAAKNSFAVAVGVGGRGGTGGHGGTATLVNAGSITTSGDGSVAAHAQSIGGGGGAAGGGTATASGGQLSLSVGVGGSGGAGGDGNAVTAQNAGNILTRGTDAIGLLAQSVGGGGGMGGKAGATAGGTSPFDNTAALFDILAAGLNFGQTVTTIGDKIVKIGTAGETILATSDELREILDQPQADAPEEGQSPQINVGVAVGGSGGAAGSGGTVGATNTGAIETWGAQSDGIYAQSIGGGGGSGGAATSTGASGDDTPVQSAIGVGGRGAGGGHGGGVTVANTGGSILTRGIGAFGIYAQSVGGGGGEGAMAGVVSGSLKSLSVGVGGDGGTGGDGGAIGVTHGDATMKLRSSLATQGKNAIAILAQSVGGGGGLARSMTTDQTFDPDKLSDNPQGRVADVQGFSLTLGGRNGIAGHGGDVRVSTFDTLATAGLGAHGIVAQSIGGGGGGTVGGQLLVVPGITSGNGGGGGGNGGGVTVELATGASIATSGHGAFGILAQSIGGGGGFAGDFSAVRDFRQGTAAAILANPGDGGTVTLTMTNATVQTAGANAPAIFAQSIGGGGGVANFDLSDGSQKDIQARGTAGGAGTGGAIAISLTGSRIEATGPGSAGILAQSDGRGSGAISIALDSASVVGGGSPDPGFPAGVPDTQRDAAAIRLLGGTANQITNAGQIVALGPYAILADTPLANTTVTNTGTISGDVRFAAGGGTGLFANRPGGVLDAPRAINLGGGTLANAGTLHVGGAGTVGTTTLTGNLVQAAGGHIVVNTNHRGGPSDLLDVTGSARLAGALAVQPAVLSRQPATVLNASGGLVLEPGFTARRTAAIRFDVQQAGTTLTVAPVAEFRTAAATLGTNQQRVATHLQHLWDSGAPLDALFTALGGIDDGRTFAQALNAVSGQAVGAIAAFRHSASRGFVANMLDDCATFAGAGLTQDEARCAWFRVFGSTGEQAGSARALGYQASSWNFQAGGQQEIAPGWFLGATIAYERNHLRGNAGAIRSRGDSVLLGAILRYQRGPWQVSGVLDAGFGAYEVRRSVSIGALGGTASSSPNAWHAGAHARLAYQFAAGGGYVQPRLDLHLTHVRSSSFTETGAGPFNLALDAAGATAFVAVPAIEIGTRIRLGDSAVLRPYASAGIGFTAASTWAATARFAGTQATPGFRAATPVPGVVGRLTLGAEILGTARWDLRLQYAAEFGERYNAHAGVARLAYRF